MASPAGGRAVTGDADAGGAGQAARPAPRPPRLSLPARVALALALGIFTGLFLGERAVILQPLADLYLRLTQLVVLPYLMVSLVVRIGSMQAATGRRLAVTGAALVAASWALALLLVGLLPLTFPAIEHAGFFSTALLNPPAQVSILDLLVPSNVFHAMANNLIPGVVLFSVLLGAALIRVDGREALLANLAVLEQGITRVFSLIAKLAPLGILAFSAVAAGTTDVAVLARIQVYLLAYAGAALLLVLVVLPLTLRAVLPLGYRDLVAIPGDVLVTAFVTSNVFIVLPTIIDRAKTLLARLGVDPRQTDATIDVLVPMAFVFPGAGKLLALLFVPYAAWLAGTPLRAAQFTELFGAGVPAMFGGVIVAIPLLMDMFEIPADLFALFLSTGFFTLSFDALATTMSLFALAVLGAGLAARRLRAPPLRLAGCIVGIVVAIVVAVAGLRAALAATVDSTYRKAEVLLGMHVPQGPLAATPLAALPPPDAAALPALERIRTRDALRVGYVPDRIPFAFTNARGQLVGLDVELAGRLANALGVARLEFAPIAPDSMGRVLDEGRVDVVLSVPYSRQWLSQVRLSAPYFDGVLGLAILDHRRSEFSSLDALRGQGTVVVGVNAHEPDLARLLPYFLPGVPLRVIAFDSPRDFFTRPERNVDAFVTYAASASAWSLLYPKFGLALPSPDPVGVPSGIATRRRDDDLAAAIDAWLVLVRATGGLRRANDYWVLGKGAEEKRRRWSIMHDVLHWGL